ncbi:MAG: hypothetical protein ABI120_05560, partial [Gemmatimonadaceae bacterium]
MNRARRCLIIGALFAAGLISPASLHPQSARDSVTTHQRLVLNIAEFQAAWQRAWREGETARQQSPNGGSQLRLRTPLIHCHPTERD